MDRSAELLRIHSCFFVSMYIIFILCYNTMIFEMKMTARSDLSNFVRFCCLIELLILEMASRPFSMPRGHYQCFLRQNCSTGFSGGKKSLVKT